MSSRSRDSRRGAAPKTEARELSRGIRRLLPALTSANKRPVRGALFEFPFDAYLLRQSALYRRSRAYYLEMGGQFRATLVSSPRTLSSDILLGPCIEYTPMEHEVIWAVNDRVQRKDPELLERLRTYCASVFHEQSHRLLWKFLPPPTSRRSEIRRYLHLAEALVVATDMALGDELGPSPSRVLYLMGSTYDPGTRIRNELRSRRAYRNYLQAAMYATYLNLELYNPEEIPGVVRTLFPGLGKFADRATHRALRLDRSFIEKTNPIWQARHWKKVEPALRRPGHPPLTLPEDPMDNRLHYLLAEEWFEKMGL